jgi:uncharacterized protein (DUF1697 family)
MPTYLALLRGINVGGKNRIKMADLRASFEKHGFTNVSTYIASGNVVFRAPRRSQRELGEEVEEMVSKEFGYEARAMVISEAALRKVVEDAPLGFGKMPDKFHSDAIFLIPPLTAAKAMKDLSVRKGVDEARPGRGVVYYSRLSAERTKSQLGKVSQTPTYSEITIRSWNTTLKLVEKLDELG